MRSLKRLLTTIACQLDSKPTYALERSTFVAGAVLQWLRDWLGIIATASHTQVLAAQGRGNVTLVSLGAPYLEPDCAGAIFLDWQVTRMPLKWSGLGWKVSVFKPVRFGLHATGHLSRHGRVCGDIGL